jgi:hypothetical protein
MWFLYFINEGVLYFIDEGFLYFIDEGFLYFVKMVVLTNHYPKWWNVLNNSNLLNNPNILNDQLL